MEPLSVQGVREQRYMKRLQAWIEELYFST